MKKLFLLFLITILYTTAFAQKPGFKPMSTEFSYSRLGTEFKFYLYSEFAFGAGGGGPRVAAHLVEKSHDTVFIKALYNTGGVWLGSYSSSNDTIVYTNTDVDTKYFNVSSNAYSKWDEFSSSDTAWNLFDSTFAIGPTGVIETPGGQETYIFPNPSKGALTIARRGVIPNATQQNGEALHAVIYNLLGRVVYQEQLRFLNNEAEIRLQVSKGNYILELSDAAGNSTHQRIVIE